MHDRIAVLERDVALIKSELEVIRRECIDAADLAARTSRMELDLVVMKGDIAQLQKDVAQLKADVAQLKTDVAQLKIDVAVLKEDVAQLKLAVLALQGEVAKLRDQVAFFGSEMARLNSELSHFATKADLKALEANLKGWMLVIAIALLSAQLAMFSYLRSMGPAIQAGAQQMQSIAPASPVVK
jgi:chromosome segregation ATPase